MFHQAPSPTIRGHVQALIRSGGEQGRVRWFLWTTFPTGSWAWGLFVRTAGRRGVDHRAGFIVRVRRYNVCLRIPGQTLPSCDQA